MLILISLSIVLILWLVVVAVVVAACRMAAAADAPEDQSPRRASTWGTVRKRIFTSPQSDQLATYK
jgi:hypothetical protein